jgi:hypothetical protein
MKKLLLSLILVSISILGITMRPEANAKPTAACSFDSSSIVYFNRCAAAGYPVDSVHQIYIDNLIVRLKTETGLDGSTSQFNSLDVLQLFTETKQVAGFNILQANYDASIITDYTGSHTYCQGFKGNGTSFKMNSGFNPFDGGTYKFKANENSFGCYINTNNREVKGLISNCDASQNGYEVRTHTNGAVSINGNTTATISQAVDNTASFSSKRYTNNHTNAYKNHYATAADNVSSVTSTVNKTFKYFCRDLGGTYSLYSTNRIAYVFFGSSNVDVQKLDRAIIEEYLKPIGAALTKRVVFDGNSFYSQLTMPTNVMDSLWHSGVKCTSHFNGIFGISIPTMITNAPTKIDPYQESYFDKQVFLWWELTNSMKGTTVNVDTVFNRMQLYFAQRHAAGWSCPMVVNTCPPFNSWLSTGIHPTLRDSLTNLTESTTINGKIRGGLATLGVDSVMDAGAVYGGTFTYDPVYKDSYGVAGVGEKNTTYFLTDGHMTSVGYMYWARTHIFPIAKYYLTH